jgi:phosphate/sulfate permease
LTAEPGAVGTAWRHGPNDGRPAVGPVFTALTSQNLSEVDRGVLPPAENDLAYHVHTIGNA